MSPFDAQVMEARVSLGLWGDALDWASDGDDGWAWILDDMTAHLFDEVPLPALLGALYEGSEG